MDFYIFGLTTGGTNHNLATWEIVGDKYTAVLNDPGHGPEEYEASILDYDVRIRRPNGGFDVFLPLDSDPKTFTIKVEKGQIHMTVTRKKWRAVKVA